MRRRPEVRLSTFTRTCALFQENRLNHGRSDPRDSLGPRLDRFPKLFYALRLPDPTKY